MTVSQEHPGGRNIILKYAGKDATAAYEPIHPKDALNTHLPKSKHLGPLESEAAEEIRAERENTPKTQDQLRVEKARREKPPLHRIISLRDMEVCTFAMPHGHPV
jgi:L-lactate dehydrogenase (cytochrome)